MKLEEVGGDVVAFGAGVVGLDDVVGWDVCGVGHGGEATGAQRRRRERRRRRVVRPLRVGEDLGDGYAGAPAGPMSSMRRVARRSAAAVRSTVPDPTVNLSLNVCEPAAVTTSASQ